MAANNAAVGCVLCREAGGLPVWQGAQLRVIRAQEEGFPAFYRVIWNGACGRALGPVRGRSQHLHGRRWQLVEQVLRERLAPTKINLATLGNVVAHLHWHMIARYDWDSHFPASVWASA